MSFPETIYDDNGKVLGRLYRDDDGTCQIAGDGGWLPGVYADEHAARYALGVDYEQLDTFTHWSVRGKGHDYRPITVADLQALTGEQR